MARLLDPLAKIPSVMSESRERGPSGWMKLSNTLMVLPPVMTIPFPPHGPISDWRMVIFVPLLMVTQSPLGLVTCIFWMVTPLWPDMVIGPEGVKFPPPPPLPPLLTLTVTEADAVFPAPSYALAMTVWEPLVDETVFQLQA